MASPSANSTLVALVLKSVTLSLYITMPTSRWEEEKKETKWYLKGICLPE
jgi:hypothetical protein